jgi:glyoxylase-like metal-dependent hydrolase (beta-lactamase superfamily II)
MRIADRWFMFEKVSDEITRIWEPYVSRVMRCNIWHVRGREHDLLVDTGLGIVSLSEAASGLFEKTLLAVATHAHVDHMGSLHEFSDRLAHPAEAAQFSKDHAFGLRRADHPASDVAMLERAGYEIDEFYVTAIPHASFDMGKFAVPAAPVTRFINDGDVIDLGDRIFEVFHLPGHSPGSIGLWEAASGTLFSGDAIYDGPLLDELPGSDIERYCETMRRLEFLPARVVHAGHDSSFCGSKLKELAQAYLRRRDVDHLQRLDQAD